MKKIFLTLVLFFSMVGYSNASALFDVMDSTFFINSNVRYQIGGAVIEDNYNQTSNGPLAAQVELLDPSDRVQRINSIARPGYLYSHIIDDNEDSGANTKTEVWSESTFRPLVNSQGPEIMFFHTSVYPYGNNEFSITDNTLGIEIFNPSWFFAPDDDYRYIPFEYNDWNTDHTYTLRMSLHGSTNAIGNQEYLTGTDFYNYAKVPEPSMISFLSIALIGLVGFRQRYKINS